MTKPLFRTITPKPTAQPAPPMATGAGVELGAKPTPPPVVLATPVIEAPAVEVKPWWFDLPIPTYGGREGAQRAARAAIDASIAKHGR